MKDKVVSSFDDAVSDIRDGASIATFCWVITGTPSNLCLALHKKRVKELTLISFNCGDLAYAGRFLTQQELPTPYLLIEQAKKIITAWIFDPVDGVPAPFFERWKKGELEIEVTGFGTLSERLRAGGSGIAGFLTRTGIGTALESNKQKIVLDGEEYILETALRADYGFVRADKADKLGNLVYRGSQRSGNHIVALASNITIAEVDEIVEVGELDPEVIVTPGIFIDRIVKIPSGGVGTLEYGKKLLLQILSETQVAEK